MKVQAFVVHLKRATARRPQAERLLAELPVEGMLIDAVDGLALSEAELAGYLEGLHRPRYPFALRRQEIGCFLSHRRVWQEIVDRNVDFGLVVEDDVRLEPGFAAALDFSMRNALISDYVRFPRRLRGEKAREVVASNGNHQLLCPRPAGLGTQAQLVGREAARELLRFTERFDRPVDTTIQMTWQHGVRVLCIRPIVIEEVDHLFGGSTTQGKSRRLKDTVLREFNRALYRAKVRGRLFREA